MFRLILVFLIFSSKVMFAQQEKQFWKNIGLNTRPLNDVKGQYTANGTGWIECINVENNKTVWAGSQFSGLFKTTNAGKSWKSMLPPRQNYGILDIWIQKTNHKTIWLGTGNQGEYGCGLLRSKDGGKTWQNRGLVFKDFEQKAIWDIEGNEEILLAISKNEIFKKMTNLDTFKSVYQLKNANFKSILITKHAIYVSGNIILVSYDSAKTWKDITYEVTGHDTKSCIENVLLKITICKNSDEHIYTFFQWGNLGFLNKSIDHGKSFINISKLNHIERANVHHCHLAIDPANNDHIYIGAVRIYKSWNGGKDFSEFSNPEFGTNQYMHDDIRHLEITKYGIFVGHDGGISVSKNGGLNWTIFNNKGLNTSLFYGISTKNVDGKLKVVGGCQDMSTMIYENRIWYNTNKVYGDGTEALILKNNPNEWYFFQNTYLLKTTDNGFNYEYINTPKSSDFFEVTLKYDAQMHQIYFGFYDILRLNNSNLKWECITNTLPKINYHLTALQFVKSNPNLAYIAYDEPTWNPIEFSNKIFVSSNITAAYDSIVWKDIGSSLPILAWRSISDIVVDEQNTNHIIVALKGFDSDDNYFRIYETKNAGTIWENKSDGLPHCNAFKLLNMQDENQTLILCTDKGIFAKQMNDEKWMDISFNFPNVKITDIEIDDTKTWVTVATFGRGIFTASYQNILKLIKHD